VNALVWRLHRGQGTVGSVGLLGLAVVLAITGVVMANEYHSALSTCGASHSCALLGRTLFQGDGFVKNLVSATVVLPALFGMLIGAPMVAREFENGTQDLAWTQGVTRRRWLSVNVGWLLGAAATWGAIVAVLVTWWRAPENALNGGAFTPGQFDIQGIVPIAYAVFAMALGVAAGAVFRRVLPAIVTALTGFVAVRVLVTLYLRPRYQSPLTARQSLTSSGLPNTDWVLSQSITGPGRALPGRGTHALAQVTPSNPPCAKHGSSQGLLSCLNHSGFARVFTYQPGHRFWAFQGIEAAIFLALAALVLGVAYWRVVATDA